MHILAFDSYNFDLFPSPDGKTSWKNSYVKYKKVGDLTNLYITSPNVMAKAKEFYGCTTFTEGLQFEN